MAAIQVAQTISKDVFAVASSRDGADRLVLDLGLPQGRVFVESEGHITTQLLQATGNSGVNVVINFADKTPTLDLAAVMAPCGRFVNAGKADLADIISVNPAVFSKNVTVTAFNMGNLLGTKTSEGHKLMQR